MKSKNESWGWRVAQTLICAVSLSVIAVLAGCAFPNFGSILTGGSPDDNPAAPPEAQVITTSADRIILEWDPSTSEIARYDVYYRAHGSKPWILLGQAEAITTPEYTVLHSVLGNGSFDFAVTAVSVDGDASEYHSTLDQTAQPAVGWYLAWQR